MRLCSDQSQLDFSQEAKYYNVVKIQKIPLVRILPLSSVPLPSFSLFLCDLLKAEWDVEGVLWGT